MNPDQKSLETVFSIAICRLPGVRMLYQNSIQHAITQPIKWKWSGSIEFPFG